MLGRRGQGERERREETGGEGGGGWKGGGGGRLGRTPNMTTQMAKGLGGDKK